jgi:hypothetical protein
MEAVLTKAALVAGTTAQVVFSMLAAHLPEARTGSIEGSGSPDVHPETREQRIFFCRSVEGDLIYMHDQCLNI